MSLPLRLPRTDAEKKEQTPLYIACIGLHSKKWCVVPNRYIYLYVGTNSIMHLGSKFIFYSVATELLREMCMGFCFWQLKYLLTLNPSVSLFKMWFRHSKCTCRYSCRCASFCLSICSQIRFSKASIYSGRHHFFILFSICRQSKQNQQKLV